MPELGGAGIRVIESPAGEEPIPLRRETVTAFVGPAPRGPANIPVVIESVAEFRRRFGSPAERSRLEWILSQFFDNGGRSAIVVRVPRSGAANRITLPGPGGTLDLDAVNPGPLEYLRAAVDYDGIPATDLWRFNLTVQRIRSRSNPLVEEQEAWRAATVVPYEEGYIGELLTGSGLVRLHGEPPRARPYVTPGAAGIGPVGYVHGRGDWRSATPPSDYDLIGSAEDSTGIHALEQVANVDLVCLLSGAPKADVGPVGIFAAERYCARRNAILLLDPPAHWSQVEDVARSQGESVFASPNVITYFPQLAELSADGKRLRTLSALGAIAGMLASQGPLDATLLRSKARVAIEPDAEEAAMLARRGVNVLRAAAPGFISFNGDVTLARRHGTRREWQQLSVRRRAVMTASTIAHSTRWAAVQKPDAETWGAVVAQVGRYLTESAAAGYLAYDASRRAFYVKCDQDTNAHREGLSFVVGLALTRPGDFAAFRFDHDATDCRITEIAWQPGLGIAG
ncbi:MAG: hypothetical protein Q8N51_17115 [Gammaproteobacteria bacterium]|nr:hypothetical protein [Gammaproteobacteria bacterium]